MSETPTIADAVEAMESYVEGTGGGVTFVELQKVCTGIGFPDEGDFQFSLPGYSNVILWAGVSEEFIDAFEIIRQSKRIVPAASSYLVYLLEGGMLNLPLAKRIPKNDYRKPHWLPIVFWTTEEDADMQRRGLFG